MTIQDIPIVNRLLRHEFMTHPAPVVDLLETQTRDPFCVLVATILSARTKDACTAKAAARLFQTAAHRGTFTPADLDRISEQDLARLIYPVCYYNAKAHHLKELPRVLREKFNNVLPHTVEELCLLPGVGRKTANLTVAVGFNLPAICVDVHVHRITNRLGLLHTKTPLATEMSLRKILPRRYWKTWNSYLVSFGQTRCAPRNPKCRDCPLAQYCPSHAS